MKLVAVGWIAASAVALAMNGIGDHGMCVVSNTLLARGRRCSLAMMQLGVAGKPSPADALGVISIVLPRR